MHTTNYFDTFISVAPDCPVERAEEPPDRGDRKSTARLQFELLAEDPYTITSDDVIFRTHALKQGIPERDWEAEQMRFFSRGQPCLRSSPLAKRYGWGFHFDDRGRVALYPRESDEYRRFARDPDLNQVSAMRSRRR